MPKQNVNDNRSRMTANDGAVGENQKHTVNHRLNKDDWEWLKKMADLHDVSVQYMMERFVKFVRAMPPENVPFFWRLSSRSKE